MELLNNELVSVIMLSHNNSETVDDSVKSVVAQTYQNWELLFIDDASKDNTLSKMMVWMNTDHRIKVSGAFLERGSTALTNMIIKETRGRWIAFIGADTIWDPEKLEQQITFMKETGRAFCYTKYGMGKEPTYVMGGPDHLSHYDMMKCCWPAYFTVMYDTERLGEMSVLDLKENNNFAYWLTISKKADCCLLPECLARQLSVRRRFSPFPIKGKFRWRYEVYRIVEGMNPIVSLVMTYRNFIYTIWKRVKYVER